MASTSPLDWRPLLSPGGICVSRVVRDQVRDKLPYRFEDRGEQNVKNIARPVRVYALCPEAVAEPPGSRERIVSPRRRAGAVAAMAGVSSVALVIAVTAWWGWPATKTTSSPPAATAASATSVLQPLVAPRLSIVVLPFTNLIGDPDQQYFADAITEDLTTDLSRLAGMLVISRNTAFTYRNKRIDTKQIGHDLGVRYVPEGSVQRSGNQLRVNAQLIDAATDAHLWAERFDGDTGDLFALQNEITRRIAIALNVELIGAEAARLTDNPDALDYILRGRAAFLKPLTREVYAEAIEARDPGSVEAQSFLAGSLSGRVMEGMTASHSADIRRAEALAEQALTASPRSPLAHFARGQVLRAQDRYREAVPQYQAAIAFNRSWVGAISALADCKLHAGPIEEVIPLVGQAIRLSPRDPDISNMYGRIAIAHLLQSRRSHSLVRKIA
jgi:adenylate cyclase